MLACPRFAVKITHIPTGLCAEVTSNNARTHHEAREKAMRLLRSRIYAKTQMNTHPSEYMYDLPDQEPFPHDLGVYKQQKMDN